MTKNEKAAMLAELKDSTALCKHCRNYLCKLINEKGGIE